MTEQKIYCKFYNYDKKEFRELEIDCKLNIYPCCYIFGDPKYPLKQNLLYTSIKEAIRKIGDYFNEDMWNSSDPYYTCYEKCKT